MIKPRTTLTSKLFLLLSSLLISFVVLELGMRLLGGIIGWSQSLSNRLAITDDNSYRILCLGESTTFFGSYKYAYPAILEQNLNSQNLSTKFRVYNEGRIGTDTEAIVEDLQDNLQRYRPHMVIAMMGVNDEDAPLNKVAESKRWYQHLKVVRLVQHIGMHLGELIQQPAGEVLIERAYDYLSDGDIDRVQEQLDKAKRAGAPPAEIQAVLGQMYWLHEGDFERSIQEYEKALRHDADLEWLYEDYFQVLYYGLRYQEAADLMGRMLARFPQAEGGYRNLAKVYLQMKEYVKLKSVLEKAAQEVPNDPMMTRLQAAYHLALGETEQADHFFGLYAEYEKQNINARTTRNYQHLRDAVLKTGAKLIAVQYPLRDVDQIKVMLGNDANVIYVSNEDNFKRQVLEHGYQHVFTDQFAGDFGHLSDVGNRLLAESVAAAVTIHYQSR